MIKSILFVSLLLTAAADAAPRSQEVIARNLSGTYDLGDYVVTGEIFNPLTVPAFDVEVELTFIDAAGKTLASSRAASVLHRIEPNATAPFVKTHYGAPAGVVRTIAKVTSYVRKPHVDYRALKIVSSALRRGITGAVVSGVLRNDSGRPLESVKLVTSFRDAKGLVIGVFFDYPVIGAMQPGATVEFNVETMDESMANARATVQAEGN